MFFRFNEIEGNITRLLDEQFNIQKEMEREEKRGNEILKYLQARYDNTYEEYKSYEDKLIIEKNLFKGLTEKENELNIEYTQFIKDLFLNIVDVFGRFDKRKFDTHLLISTSNIINSDCIILNNNSGKFIQYSGYPSNNKEE